MPHTTHSSDLAALRLLIDEIDASILGLLGKRFDATNKVGWIKAKCDFAAVDAAREAAQRKRYAELASQHQLNEDLVQAVFRLVIDEVVRNHQALASKGLE